MSLIRYTVLYPRFLVSSQSIYISPLLLNVYSSISFLLSFLPLPFPLSHAVLPMYFTGNILPFMTICLSPLIYSLLYSPICLSILKPEYVIQKSSSFMTFQVPC